MKAVQFETFTQIPKDFTGTAEFGLWMKIWLKNGYYHRTNGPSIDFTDGTKYWYLNGNYYAEEKYYWNVLRLTRRVKRNIP